MKIICVCTAGKTRSVWMSKHINDTFPGVTATAVGINSRLAEDRLYSYHDLFSADLVLTVSSLHLANVNGFIRGSNYYLGESDACVFGEVVNVPLMRLWRTDPEKALASIDRIIRRRLK